MNHTKYRVCLIVLLVAAVAAGILFYVYGQEKEEPYLGGTLVERSVNVGEYSMADGRWRSIHEAGIAFHQEWKGDTLL